MIVIALSCFTSLLKANNTDNFFTGEGEQSDTTITTVTIDAIRKANIKLTERIYLKHEIAHQKAMIEQYIRLNEVNDSTIEYYKSNIDIIKTVNDNLDKDLKEQTNKYNKLKTYSTYGGVIAIGAIISLLVTR